VDTRLCIARAQPEGRGIARRVDAPALRQGQCGRPRSCRPSGLLPAAWASRA